MRSRFQGFRVTPQVGDSVNIAKASSGRLVLPITIAPAARSRLTISQSSVAGSSTQPVPWVVSSPATSCDVLDRDRDAEQRRLAVRVAALLGLDRGGERRLGPHDAEGVQLRVEPPDPLEVEPDQLPRRYLTGPHRLRLAREAREGEVLVRHGRAL